jgi:thioredoxin 2
MANSSIISTCRSCGTNNRIPVRHLSDTGRCGTCKSPIHPPDHPLDVDARVFDDILQSAKVPVLADFWAAWCGPCQMAAPEVQQLAAEMRGRALIVKVDTEKNPDIASRFGIRSIPNFVVFRGGQPVFQQAGFASRSQMRQWLELG